MKPDNLIKNILAIIIGLVIVFFAGEMLIRVYLKYNTMYDLEMTKYAIHIKADSDNPLIGHVHQPNTSMRLMNKMVSINSDGLRDIEYSRERNKKYRIIFLGDSLTFGWGVEKEESFESILENRFNDHFPTEIINFGAGNYNTEQEINLFFDKGLQYKPDKVVVFYFINDAELTPARSKWWFLGYSQLISFYWSRVHAIMDKYIPSKSYKNYYSELYNDKEQGWKNTKIAFMQLKQVCQRAGIALQVVLLPELHDTENKIFNKIYEKVSSFLAVNSIDYLNLATMFAGYGNSMELWVSYDDAHPNKVAHKAIADATYKFISKRCEIK